MIMLLTLGKLKQKGIKDFSGRCAVPIGIEVLCSQAYFRFHFQCVIYLFCISRLL